MLPKLTPTTPVQVHVLDSALTHVAVEMAPRSRHVILTIDFEASEVVAREVRRLKGLNMIEGVMRKWGTI